MLGSRVCWHLLLGCALLLGQPVFGDSDVTEEPPLAESEEQVPISPEPEETVPELQEPAELLPESEESKESIPEELEKGMTSDEMLESNARRERKWLQEDLSRSWNYEFDQMQITALEHHHQHSDDYYRPFEKANLIAQKAIGTMIYLKMLVVKTNCTNDRRPEEEESDHSYYYRLYHADRYPRNCEPLSDEKESQIRRCRFTFFEDARNPGQPDVIDHQCIPLNEEYESHIDFFRQRRRRFHEDLL